MNSNELMMKMKGEDKIWNSIKSKSGSKKKISSTQVGQQLLFDEALRIFVEVKDWIYNKTARRHRSAFTEYFTDDEFILKKITETMLLMSGDIDGVCDNSDTPVAGKSRRKKIQTLKDRVLTDLDFENCFRFLEVVIDFSNYFEVERLLNKDQESWRWSVKYKCTLSKVILSKLSLEAAVAFYPLATLVKPIDWKWDEESGLSGGYEGFQYPLVRSNNFDIDYANYDKGIFDRANYIQQTPWIVNEAVLEQLNIDIKIPKRSDFLKMDYPNAEPSRWEVDLKSDDHGLSEDEFNEIEAHRAEFRDKAALYDAEKRDYESAVGKYRAVKLAMQIAERYSGETIYFPHNYDFRGRIYPISIGLSPQGSDAVKALLLYKNTEELNETGEKWNWAYLASLYGEDKLPFTERVERGKQLLHADYLSADEPYQFLSHQIELQKWFYDKSYTPNTRVHLDACNSGSQFTSAITGDVSGCKATNVLPTIGESGETIRQDAYILVAEKAIKETKSLIIKSKDKDETEILLFLEDLLNKHGRKLCKTPTMVSNYGGTAAGRAKILWQMFRELGCEKKWITKKNSHLFSKIIGDSIQGVLNGGKAFELYIQKMSNVIARGNNPVVWVTYDGFHVIHKKNKELKSKQILCSLPGSRGTTKIIKKVYSKELSGPKMRSAISPNYIHSLDAELLRETSRRMQEHGIEDSDWIHDSFGCHPNHVDTMLLFAKEEFVKMVKRDPLKSLDAHLRSQVGDEASHQKALDKLVLPNFGEVDMSVEIDDLVNSDWFFS